MASNVIDLFKNVRYYSSGILDEKVSRALEVGQAKFCPYLSPFCDYYIIGTNTQVEETTDLDVPVVSQDWVLGSMECGKLLPAAAFSLSPSRDQLMSGVRLCVSGVSRPDACSIWAMIKFNGGQVDTRLTEDTTHLVATSDQGKLYEEALARSDVFVVTPDWVTDSVRRRIMCVENIYHPRLLDTSRINLINTPQIASTDQHSDPSETETVSETTGIKLNTPQIASTDQDASEIETVYEMTGVANYNPAILPVTCAGIKRRSKVTWFTNLFSTSSKGTSPSLSESIKKKVKIENKPEEENKIKEKDLKRSKVEGSFKKFVPSRRGRGRPKGSDSKHSLRKEKARENKSKASHAKNPIDYPFNSSAKLAVPDSDISYTKGKIMANENGSSIDQNQNKIVEVHQTKMRHKQKRANQTSQDQVVSGQLNKQTMPINPTTQKQIMTKHANNQSGLVLPTSRHQMMTRKYTKTITCSSGTQHHLGSQPATHQTKIDQTTELQVESQCLTNQIKSDTIKQKVASPLKTDSFQTSNDKEEKQTKIISSVKRKLEEKENMGKVSKKFKKSKKSYCCQICDKAFAHKRNLLVHIRTVHEGFRIPCVKCNHLASTKSNLKQHMASKHKNEKDDSTQGNVQTDSNVIDNIQIDNSVKEDVKENADTCPSNPIAIPVTTHTRNGSFHTVQLAEKKQVPLPLDTTKCNPTQTESSQLSQQHVGNSPQGKDFKRQEYPHNQDLKHHQTAINSQPALSLSMLPLPNSSMVTSVQTTPENIKEISPMVRSWTVEETITRISLLDPKLALHVQIFRSHEIDGRALLLLTPEMMVEYLDMKLGPALKLGSIIQNLKRK